MDRFNTTPAPHSRCQCDRVWCLTVIGQWIEWRTVIGRDRPRIQLLALTVRAGRQPPFPPRDWSELRMLDADWTRLTGRHYSLIQKLASHNTQFHPGRCVPAGAAIFYTDMSQPLRCQNQQTGGGHIMYSPPASGAELLSGDITQCALIYNGGTQLYSDHVDQGSTDAMCNQNCSHSFHILICICIYLQD